MRPIGMLYEPVDIRAINAMVRARFAAAPPRRVDISRQDAAERRTPNEAEVMRSLSLFGFERVMIGQMPVKESIEILASASTVVVPLTCFSRHQVVPSSKSTTFARIG